MRKKRRGIALDETLRLIPWYILLDALVFALFAAVGAELLSVLLGLAAGSAYALLNFYLLGMTVEKALKKPPEKAKRYMTANYFIRYAALFAILAVFFLAGFLNPIAALVPFLYVKVIFLIKSFRKEGEDGRPKDCI